MHTYTHKYMHTYKTNRYVYDKVNDRLVEYVPEADPSSHEFDGEKLTAHMQIEEQDDLLQTGAIADGDQYENVPESQVTDQKPVVATTVLRMRAVDDGLPAE